MYSPTHASIWALRCSPSWSAQASAFCTARCALALAAFCSLSFAAAARPSLNRRTSGHAVNFRSSFSTVSMAPLAQLCTNCCWSWARQHFFCILVCSIVLYNQKSNILLKKKKLYIYNYIIIYIYIL